MREIQLKDAKATLSAVVDDALGGNGSIITRHGERTAVVISYEEYQKLKQVPSFGWLLTNAPLEDDDLPVRKPGRLLRDDDI
ncbi:MULTISPECIES: type II toxin-antitoxin system Phd/YefM family antitoxin [unclassified Rhizobium]|uniref:type II toxin-antitoxin system Phd/YefM family antitoxin n=1 Tax=unclassified Rhizobium TaxID=2613769 RepID=UPI000EAA906A|nr:MULTISPECIES: type II toxin-antitoxin system Phd/YefM family antitoxin [unclassified Rhizobium]AYG68570.1 type II toxin-antitoxin system Phd/YefM family antitoxin [Rhizobium sp. CCGE531]AYG74954.1 type II toxin-antitoxin system Phd/YefM family antitoxin [Rhizobium sp. CCGE532]